MTMTLESCEKAFQEPIMGRGDVNACPDGLGHFFSMSKREISSFRRGHRSEKVPHSVRLTKGGLKLFGQFLYGNNTFQKGAAIREALKNLFF